MSTFLRNQVNPMEPYPAFPMTPWAEIDLDAIVHNIRAVRSLLPEKTAVAAVVKSDAYGHGLVEVSRAAVEGGARFLAVAFPEEGIELRRAGITEPVLVLGYIPPEQAGIVIENNLTPAVFSRHTAEALSLRASSAGRLVPVHVKVDTGMGRLGVSRQDAAAFLRYVDSLPGLEVEGVLTHLAAADEEDKGYTYGQLELFEQILSSFTGTGKKSLFIHAANSAAALSVPDSHYNLIRLGISMYGYYPSEAVVPEKIKLQPALSFKSRIIFIKTVPPGVFIGYGCTYQAVRESVIATVPVGYGHGYNRHLSNRGEVLVKGKRVPVRGRVCMDYTMIDVSDVEGVKVGDEVVLYGRQEGEEISVDQVAALLGTISYEVLCTLDKRVCRVYLKNGKVVASRSMNGGNNIKSEVF